MHAPLLVCWLTLPLASVLAAGPAEGRLTVEDRLQPEHLKATHEARERFARQRVPLPQLNPDQDFRAVIHVHAEDSEHTKGTREQVLEAARKTGVSVVMYTDHRGPKADTWHGLREGVLFFAGTEDGKGELRFPAFDAAHVPQTNGELRFLTHAEERTNAAMENLDGMEICNRHADAKLDQAAQNHFIECAAHPDKWEQLLRDYKAYPDEMFAAGCDYREVFLTKWDRDMQKHPLTAIGANDAHRNTIFLGQVFDPYEVSFRNLCTHILAPELTENAIRQALRAGHAYVSHDWLCDPTGFVFGAVNNLGVFPMGDRAPFFGTTRIVGLTPLAAHLKLFRNGVFVSESSGTNLTHEAKETGAYRLEAWLKVDGEERPWIYSNPVYVRLPGAAEIELPSNDLGPTVAAKKDISYIEGQPEDDAKHKLDLYLPKDKQSAPVFFFVHGGAWRFGDRSQYPAVGNRFAREGILTVVPSYRLAPKNPHPAQIEDVAAAFAWTVGHIAGFGGDTNRIYIGGHSAGGHLVALLAFHDRYLKAHHLSTDAIRGVICLSGVYDLTVGESQASVFGKDAQVRKDGSPLFQIRTPAPPFLVTYCQWDYLTLPLQARQFHAALRKAGVVSDLLYVPAETHITEMVHVPKEGDLTATAILKFIH
ncbi:MAG TPA: alpha/beta hydrolase fold domain-containing protein [Verrucomicrobiae bacterium]|jgi:acetyl esterase/lipase